MEKFKAFGRMQNADKVIFQGNFLSSDSSATDGEEAVLHGKGTEIWPNGFTYTGDFYMGKNKAV